MVSVRMAPVNSTPTCSPITVTTGISALRNAWIAITRKRRQPLGAGGADVILAQHLQHGRPRHAGDDGERHGAEHDRRQDEMRQRRAKAPRSPDSSVSISRKPVTGSMKYCTAMRPDTGVQSELHREQQDQQQSPPEDRHRIAGERDPHDAVIEDGVAPDRRHDAGRQAEASARTAWRRPTARSVAGNKRRRIPKSPARG